MRTLSTILASFIAFSIWGQDITSYGSTIYPTEKTNISIDKEVLSFHVRDEIAYVDILFELNNPEATEQKLLIEFKTPAQFKSSQSGNPCEIKDFTITHDNAIIPYNLQAATCEDCELKDPNEPIFEDNDYGIFVFQFEINFKPGLNKINHSFNFPRSGDIDVFATYNHVLKTGENWARGTIKDFTVNIDMGPNQYFFITDLFGETADWELIGTGKITDDSFSYYTQLPSKFIRILSGYLQIKVSDLQSSDHYENLSFGTINPYFFTSDIGSFDHIEPTKNTLRIIRNTIYAQHGYIFKSTDLKERFSQFDWYMPNPNLKMEDIKLTNIEKRLLEEIIEKEGKL